MCGSIVKYGPVAVQPHRDREHIAVAVEADRRGARLERRGKPLTRSGRRAFYELPTRRPSRWSSFQEIVGFALTIDRNTQEVSVHQTRSVCAVTLAVRSTSVIRAISPKRDHEESHASLPLRDHLAAGWISVLSHRAADRFELTCAEVAEEPDLGEKRGGWRRSHRGHASAPCRPCRSCTPTGRPRPSHANRGLAAGRARSRTVAAPRPHDLERRDARRAAEAMRGRRCTCVRNRYAGELCRRPERARTAAGDRSSGARLVGRHDAAASRRDCVRLRGAHRDDRPGGACRAALGRME